jgi:hypothetical protein
VRDTTRLDEEKNYNLKQFLPATALTADIVNNGIVLMYFKNRNGVIIPVERDNYSSISEKDSTTGDFYSFNHAFVFKEKYLSYLVSSWTGYQSYINGNRLAIRYVLIPGMAQARSLSDLKNKPYSEIAKLYNITD